MEKIIKHNSDTNKNLNSIDDLKYLIDEVVLESIQSKYSNYKILPGEYYEQPKPALELFNQEENCWNIMGTYGNISMLKGKAKSKKTFLLTLIVSAAVKSDAIDKFIRYNNPGAKTNILYFDTEQHKSDVNLVLERICKLSEYKRPTNLHAYALRSMGPAERLKAVEELIYDTEDLGVVVLDGIRDLVVSINDESESSALVSKLMKWSEELNIHIITVLHENPSSDKARGHLGTEMMNKAETVIGIENDSEDYRSSFVRPEMTRKAPFKAFKIVIGDMGTPRIDSSTIILDKKKKSIKLNELNDSGKYALLLDALNIDGELSHSDLVEAIQKSTKKIFKKHVGVSQTKEFITNSLQNGLITQDKPRDPYKLAKEGPINEPEEEDDDSGDLVF